MQLPHTNRQQLIWSLVVIAVLVGAMALIVPVMADAPQSEHIERSLSTDVIAGNGSVEVTVTASFSEAQNLSLNETIDPGVDAIEIVDADGANETSIDANGTSVQAEYIDREQIAFTYRVRIPANASANQTFTIDGTITGIEEHAIGTDVITISDDPGVAVSISAVPSSVVAGDTLNVDVALENLDNESTGTVVVLTANGETVDFIDVSMEAFEQRNETLTWTTTEDDIGEVDLEVSTDTHNDTASLTVLAPAFFSLSDLSAPSTVTQFDRFDVTVEVENTGDVDGTQELTLALEDGSVLRSTNVSRDAGESTTHTFSNLSFEETGFYTLVVSSDDDTTDRPIHVEATTANRNLNSEVVGPGGTVQVSITAEIEGEQNLTLSESITPAAQSIEIVDDGGADAISVDDGSIEATFNETERIDLVYRVTVPSDAQIGDTFELDGSIEGTDTIPAGTDTITVTEDPGVVIHDVSAPDEIIAGNPAELSVAVENLDNTSVDTTLSVLREGDVVAETTVTLDAHEQRTVPIEWVPALDAIGPTTLEVTTEVDNTTLDVTVLQPATFEVTDISSPSPVTQFYPFSVSVSIENTGEVSGQQMVTLSYNDGTELAAASVELSAGEETTITFDELYVNTTGHYDLIAATEDDSSDRLLVVEAATSSITVVDQFVGTDTAGDPAVFVSDVVADTGWSIVVVEDTAGTEIVQGIHELTAAPNATDVIVSMPESTHESIDVRAIVVADRSDITIGEELPAGTDILASDSGTAFTGSIEASAVDYEDETARIHLDAIHFEGTPRSPNPSYTIGVYEIDALGERTLIGSGTFAAGSSESVSIDLDSVLHVGEHDLALRMHASDMGGPGAVFRQVDGEDIVPYEVTQSVSVFETPEFVIESIEYDDTAIQGSSIDLSVTIRNAGPVGGTQTLWIAYGDRVELHDLSLGANESDTVAKSLALSPTMLGDITVDIEVGDASESIVVTVNPPPETETPDDSIIPGFTLGVVVLAFAVVAVGVWVRRRT